MARNRMTSWSKGFTLIEVLVVVAIIALLVAILLPSLSRARATARTVQCRNQVRQAVTAINEYAHEYKDQFPRGGNQTQPTVYRTTLVARMFGDRTKYTNYNQLNYKSYEAFHCPDRSAKLPFPFLDYAVNALSADGPEADGRWQEVWYSKLSDYKRPAQVAYLFDAEHEAKNRAGIGGSLEEARVNWWNGVESGIWRSDPFNSSGSHLAAVDGMDIFAGGLLPQGFGSTNVTDERGERRAARKMHMDRWTNASFLDGHGDGIQLANKGYTSGPNGNYAYWLRHCGVKEDAIRRPTNSAATILD